jgi:hypothetical protein
MHTGFPVKRFLVVTVSEFGGSRKSLSFILGHHVSGEINRMRWVLRHTGFPVK